MKPSVVCETDGVKALVGDVSDKKPSDPAPVALTKDADNEDKPTSLPDLLVDFTDNFIKCYF